MQTMKANVFHGPNKIGIEEVPRPMPARRSGNSNHANDHLRDRSAHPARRIPGEAGAGDRT